MPVVTRVPTTNAVITTGWTNPTNAYADDNVYATAAPAKSASITSEYAGFDFGSVIPDGSTINSVTVRQRWFVDTTASTATLGSQAYVGTTAQGTEFTNTAEPLTETLDTYTVASLTRADLLDLRLRLRAGRGTGNTGYTASLDAVDVVVDYTAPASAYGVSGAHVWLKADAITGLADGAAVSTWADSTGAGRNATQTFADEQPTYRTGVTNGKPVVRFDGANDYLKFANVFTGLTAAEVFIVVKIVLDPPTDGLRSGLWDLGSTSDATHYPWTDGTIYDEFGTSARKSTVNPTPALTSWRVYNVSSGSGVWANTLDNVDLLVTDINTVGWATTPLLGVSADANFFYRLDGDIAEFLVYNRTLTAAERKTVHDELRAKWIAPAPAPVGFTGWGVPI